MKGDDMKHIQRPTDRHAVRERILRDPLDLVLDRQISQRVQAARERAIIRYVYGKRGL
jgi:hypothetical protein